MDDKDIERIKQELMSIPLVDELTYYKNPCLVILDAVMSRSRVYETTVVPRLNYFKTNYPEINTLDMLINTINKVGSENFASKFLDYQFADIGKVILDTAMLFNINKNNFEDLEGMKYFASTPNFYKEIKKVNGIGIATARYLAILLGIDTVKPDIHIIRFISQSIDRKVSEEEAVDLLTKAAKEMRESVARIDNSIWQFMSNSNNQLEKEKIGLMVNSEPMEVRINKMTLFDIRKSLEEYQAMFKREIQRNVPIGELTHLTGRIGELYVADKVKGTMAFDTNQKGFDVFSNDDKRISVKTTSSSSGSHQFFFNANTIEFVDEVFILKIDRDGEIQELFYDRIDNARKLMVDRGKLAISRSKLSNLEKYLTDKVDISKEIIGQNTSILSMDYHDFKIKDMNFRLFINGNVIRVEENGVLIISVKPKLREICGLLGIEVTYPGSGSDPTTNNSYAKKIVKKISNSSTH